MLSRHAARPLALALCLIAGPAGFSCSSSSSDAGAPATPVLVPSEPFDCVPLTEECSVPFPSNVFARPASSETGMLLNLRPENFPGLIATTVLATYPPDVVNGNDGFSAVAPILASLPVEPDPASLPASLAESVSPGASIRLLNTRTFEPVPFAVTLDEPALSLDPPRYLLSVLPAKPLDPGDTFAAVLTTRIRARGGGAMPAYPSFARLASGVPTGEAALDRLAALYAPFLDTLERDLGEDRAGLVLAWAFTVRSDRSVTKLMKGIRRAVLDRAGRRPPTYEITGTNPPIPVIEPTIERALVGTYTTPEFRGLDRRIEFDAEGRPVEQRENRLEFVLKLPRDASRPAPVVIFGHGLGGWKETMMQVTDDLGGRGFAVMAIDVGGHASRVAQDGSIYDYFQFERILEVRDLLMQTIADQMQLVRLIQGDLSKLDWLPDGAGDGRPDLDARRVYYVGQSLGTVLGVTLAACEPQIVSAALNVAGGGFVNILTASPSFAENMVPRFLPPGASASERLFVFILGQMLVDDFEPLVFASHLRQDPFRGDPARDVLVQEAIGDGFMPNASSEEFARALAIPLVLPSVTDVYGLPKAPSPAAGAGLFQFEVFENPSLAHWLLLMTPGAGGQIATFFATREQDGVGRIESP